MKCVRKQNKLAFHFEEDGSFEFISKPPFFQKDDTETMQNDGFFLTHLFGG